MSKEAAIIFNKYAKEYQDKFMDLSLYHSSFNLFCDSIQKDDADILELACGPGNITQYLLKRRPQFKILGIDLAPNMIALAQTNNPAAEFKVMDCRDIAALDKKYDGVMAGFCLPYLSKEEAKQLVVDIAALLNPAGVVYISTMEEDELNRSGFKKGSKGDEIYMNYHQSGYLTAVLEDNGFKIIYLQRQLYSEPNGVNATDLLIIAGK